ncbi:Gfo/Idh/MocA family oxidoreductase [Bradyrhizobium brasilense]|uniref:Gfo/Idh/MocA family oxidoreductase n=1 Tax=Bradyrhizobium brasilense TaxID=1419277 RepID=UPI001456E4C0|nr:Gfo/Idh/MocA family oxidoreductase [Bradyrhizobium brasilense]
MRLTTAVIGLGLGRLHAKYYLQTPAVEPIVVRECDPTGLDRFRHKLAKPAAFHSNIATMSKKERPDVASILAPDHVHRGHVEQVMTSDHHLLLTEPIASARANADIDFAGGCIAQVGAAHVARDDLTFISATDQRVA